MLKNYKIKNRQNQKYISQRNTHVSYKDPENEGTDIYRIQRTRSLWKKGRINGTQ